MCLTNPLLLYINFCLYCKGTPGMPYKSSVVVHQFLSLLQRYSRCALQILCCCKFNFCLCCKDTPDMPYKSSIVVNQFLSLLQDIVKSIFVSIAKVLQMCLTNPLLLYINFCLYCKGTPDVPYKSSVVVHQFLSLLQRYSRCALQILCYCTSIFVSIVKILQMCLTNPLLLYINFCLYCKGTPYVPYISSVVVHQFLFLFLLQRCFRCTLQILCCCTSTTVTIAKVLQMYLPNPLLLYINYCHCCKGASYVPSKSSVVVHQLLSLLQRCSKCTLQVLCCCTSTTVTIAKVL